MLTGSWIENESHTPMQLLKTFSKMHEIISSIGMKEMKRSTLKLFLSLLSHLFRLSKPVDHKPFGWGPLKMWQHLLENLHHLPVWCVDNQRLMFFLSECFFEQDGQLSWGPKPPEVPEVPGSLHADWILYFDTY